MKKARAFTLVEILIVVVLLGVLAGVVLPLVADGAISARESALSHDLNMLRRLVLMYTAQHLEVRPGYPNGDPTAVPTEAVFMDQITMASNSSGDTAAPGTAGFNRGPYMAKLPPNPLNGLSSVQVLGNADDFPADADNSHGWIYKPATAEVRADSTGAGDDGQRYYDY